MSIGYDKLSLNNGLLLHLTFEEGAGVPYYGREKAHHRVTPNVLGPPSIGYLASGIPYLSFSTAGSPDFLECPAVDSADLNFIAGDFSGVVWLEVTDLGDLAIFNRGDWFTDGWKFYKDDLSKIAFCTFQAGVSQVTYGKTLLASLPPPPVSRFLLGFSRAGASTRVFVNGSDDTMVPSNHINPVTSNRKFHVGCLDDEGMNTFVGKIFGGKCGPRIWGRYLYAQEHRGIWLGERGLIGV